ncbi:uncharacterized protein I206_104637 [Kwoniella pini CBS 10737]|uniref:Uncharacterized protein n=1 Tax=Kwoniella pini CBS 10737 TaxID=1296096 RepID=A0A1B9I7L4_9TREE|nr:uncharacterized protein I206_02173 [Kwoniella pini CBS 10737]OCF51459.1 hypothetical protein I206_02173 [Kwoniella pini CBS 10737]
MFSISSSTKLAALLAMLGNQVTANSAHAKYEIYPAQLSKLVDLTTNAPLAVPPAAYKFDAMNDRGSMTSKTFKWVALDENDDQKELWSIELTASPGYPWDENKAARYELKLDSPWATISDDYQAAHLASNGSSYICYFPPCADAPVFDL